MGDFGVIDADIVQLGLRMSIAIGAVDISLDVFFLYVFFSYFRAYQRVDANDRQGTILSLCGIVANFFNICTLAALVQFFTEFASNWYVVTLFFVASTFATLAGMKVLLHSEDARRRRTNVHRVLRAKAATRLDSMGPLNQQGSSSMNGCGVNV
ncbi:hypothetical protein HDU82_002922 [Entophlyctis luteolus]|nr:hypothetical protein HDU82_002922 [Entophlyctis luteolus]